MTIEDKGRIREWSKTLTMDARRAVLFLLAEVERLDAPRWIKVEEQLPEYKSYGSSPYVLIARRIAKKIAVDIAYHSRYGWYTSCDYDECGDHWIDGVVAWQPLPDPPEESSFRSKETA